MNNVSNVDEVPETPSSELHTMKFISLAYDMAHLMV